MCKMLIQSTHDLADWKSGMLSARQCILWVFLECNSIGGSHKKDMTRTYRRCVHRTVPAVFPKPPCQGPPNNSKHGSTALVSSLYFYPHVTLLKNGHIVRYHKTRAVLYLTLCILGNFGASASTAQSVERLFVWSRPST